LNGLSGAIGISSIVCDIFGSGFVGERCGDTFNPVAKPIMTEGCFPCCHRVAVNSCLLGYYLVRTQRREVPRNPVLVDKLVDSLLQLHQFRRHCFPLRDLMGSATTEEGNAGEKESEAS